MLNFQRPETVVCGATIKTSAGVLTNPATNIKITITNPAGGVVVNSQSMSNDSTGVYHYDYNPASDAVLGNYKVKVTAVDGTRTTIRDGAFTLEE